MNEYKVEKATTFPSQAPKRLNDMMLRRGRQVLKAHGAKWGNRHVETMYTSEDGGKGIEDNPRMGGFFVFNATLAQTGYNLIQGGIRAMLGLPVRFERGTRPAVVEERIINPEFTGEIVAIRGLEEAKRIPGVTDIEIYKTVGDGVIAAPEHTSDWIGRVQTSARTYDEAMAIQMKALNTIEFDVEVDTPQGKKIKTSKAAFDHEKAPVADQLAELNKKTTPR